jgi:hypothetical protein
VNIIDSDACSFCKSESESIMHIFVECNNVRQIWIKLRQWLVTCGFLNLEPCSDSDIILGMMDMQPIVNFAVLITKVVIYRCKVMGRSPAFAAVRAYMKYVMHTEQFIASANDNMDTFYGKWSAVLLALNAC